MSMLEIIQTQYSIYYIYVRDIRKEFNSNVLGFLLKIALVFIPKHARQIFPNAWGEGGFLDNLITLLLSISDGY